MKRKILFRGGFVLSLVAPLTVMSVSCNNDGKVNSETEEETPTKQYTEVENKKAWKELHDGIEKAIQKLTDEDPKANDLKIVGLKQLLHFVVKDTYEDFVALWIQQNGGKALTQNEIHNKIMELKKDAEDIASFTPGWITT